MKTKIEDLADAFAAASVNEWGINQWTQPDSSIAIGAVGAPLIARVVLRDVSINQQKANAEFIVKAQNMMPALLGAVAALKLIESIRDYHAEHGEYPIQYAIECFDEWAANVASAALDALQ